ncbi:MAG: DUF4287 domain-containing protein [Actinomycetota bacterium]|nr:DUF4287 domain-containing protein [Actinomycetota bacterium]
MVTLQEQVATQLNNIKGNTGLTPERTAELARSSRLEKHGEIVALLKSEYGLTHGNANLLAVKARELLAGGPVSDDELLAAQYAGGKAHLRPVLDELMVIAEGLGDDVAVVVQKTGVSLRRTKQFAVVRAASAKRVELGLNLPATPEDERVRTTTGMCSHRVDLPDAEALDEAVAGWLRTAYQAAG